MSHVTSICNSPAWRVENRDGHSVTLFPCTCCEATTLALEIDAATVSLHIDDIRMLEELRDSLSAAVEHHKDRPKPSTGNGKSEEADRDYHVWRWQGHAPRAIRAVFLEWLDIWFDEDETPEEDLEMFRGEMLPALSACTDILPCEYCDRLDLPHGSTYADAVEVLRSNV